MLNLKVNSRPIQSIAFAISINCGNLCDHLFIFDIKAATSELVWCFKCYKAGGRELFSQDTGRLHLFFLEKQNIYGC